MGDGTFESDTPPGCLYGYALQAGTARIARKRRDEIQFYPASRHAVVFCNNRIFRINLLGGEDGEAQVQKMLGVVVGGGVCGLSGEGEGTCNFGVYGRLLFREFLGGWRCGERVRGGREGAEA